MKILSAIKKYFAAIAQEYGRILEMSCIPAAI